MNDKPGEPANSGGPEQVDSAAQAAEGALNGQAGAQQLAELKAENADLRDKLLRNIAEMENLRRRTDRERADTAKYAISEFARDAVTIGDNLRRAIEAAQKEPLDVNPALKTLLEGVEVTERDLFKVLARHGITRFDPLGEKFDPHVHEAMVKMDVPGAAADQVVQVLHAGYKIADRVLRPAAVIVAKGGTPARAEPLPAPAPADPPLDLVKPAHEYGAEEAEHGGRPRTSSMHINVMGEAPHDPDVLRGPRGAPRGPFNPGPGPFNPGQGRGRDRAWGEKRGPSSVTRPISEDKGPVKRDGLMSTFGKRGDKDEQR
jgi:molecular chaperone GrpE